MELAIIIVLFIFIILNSKIIEGKFSFKKLAKKVGKFIPGVSEVLTVISMVKDAKKDYKTIKNGCV